MIKIRWGLGGLFVLWVIAMALWAAVGLARSARGDSPPSPTPARQAPVGDIACRVGEIVVDNEDFSLALTSASPASLALIDVAGRRVAEEALGGLGPGPHRLTPAWRLTAGVYWLVLRQEGTTVRRRLVRL